MAEQAVKTRKRSRRNFAKEVDDLKAYLKISIELLSESLSDINADYWKGYIAAYQKILAKMDSRS